MIGAMSAGRPARWTTTTARVAGVSTASIVAAERFWVSRSTSANTGVAPAVTTEETEAMNDRGVTTTSSPAPMPSARNATSSASVPLASATACSHSAQAANSRSNSRVSPPVQ